MSIFGVKQMEKAMDKEKIRVIQFTRISLYW